MTKSIRWQFTPFLCGGEINHLPDRECGQVAPKSASIAVNFNSLPGRPLHLDMDTPGAVKSDIAGKSPEKPTQVHAKGVISRFANGKRDLQFHSCGE